MAKLPIYGVISSGLQSTDKYSQLLRLRDTLMQSDRSIKFCGWNFENLKKSLTSKKKNRLGFVVIETHRESSGKCFVLLNERQECIVEDIFSAATNGGNDNGYWVFVVTSVHSLSRLAIETLTSSAEKSGILLYCLTNDLDFYAFAASCEAAHFWDMSSAKLKSVSYSDISKTFENLLFSYQEIDKDVLVKKLTRTPENFTDIAWIDGKIFAFQADVEKIREEARIEQQLDAIKRIHDASAYPRFQHSKTEDRLISTQALFWLLQIYNDLDVKSFITETQFFKEFSPNRFEIEIPARLLREKNSIDIDLNSILSWFLYVDGGSYSVGHETSDVDSEPPANQTEIALDSFLIMKSPVTHANWGDFVEHDRHTNLPITNVSWFDCFQYSKIVENFLKKHLNKDIKVCIPTEYQWEVAARGKYNNNYPWGKEFISENCNAEMKVGHPTPVGAYSPQGDSWCGCQDMSGNVREWTSSYGGTRSVDWKLLSNISPEVEIEKIRESSRVVIRGGSYSYDMKCVQTWVRNTQIACREDNQTGFRLVITDI